MDIHIIYGFRNNLVKTQAKNQNNLTLSFLKTKNKKITIMMGLGFRPNCIQKGYNLMKNNLGLS